ncbi:MAG: UDP-N-acetylmuramoyl-L-alanyl-D-glutamate--2,6-diaminopimelate ligase [Gammaproteobacteria bacterium]|nr:UDP-N-acetylmuramoyl-L-alanyl-D-glutamate--2,6-diaminopimelate ligase [Gammaproteobacteria bacterium]
MTTLNRPMLLSRLLADFAYVEPAKDAEISGLSIDSRFAQNGDAFFALTGIGFDGRAFIADAVAAGVRAVIVEADDVSAWAALCQQHEAVLIAVPNLHQVIGDMAARFYDQPSQNMTIVGVTGTNGKTSVSQFIAQCLSDESSRCGIVGTLGSGFWGQLQSSGFTTPQAPQLQQSLAKLYADGARHVAMEVSSHGLHQGRINGVRFDVAVLTNLTRDHLDYHGDMQAYADAKSRLFRMPGLRAAVINRDDQLGQKLLAELQGGAVTCLAYGLGLDESVVHNSALTLTGHIVQRDRHGMVVQISGSYGDAQLSSKLLGEFNAYNLLAVLGSLLVMGWPLQQAIQKIQTVVPPAGRMECFQKNNSPLVVVDYAHTPDALAEVLRTLRDHCEGNLWVVFGCGGDRDPGKRPEMGRIAQTLADQIVITNDNPRSEDPMAIITDIVAGMSETQPRTILPERQNAIEFAIKNATGADVVLVAGKGHEDYQLVGNQRFHFSDRECVGQMLEAVA